MKYAPNLIHGHSITCLNGLLKAQLDTAGDISLTGTVLGGWSNLNLLARSNGSMVVVKLPPFYIEYSDNPYEYQYRVLRELAPLNIAPSPIQTGRLDDTRKTPFLLLNYLHGDVLGSLKELSERKARLLDETLLLLNSSAPLGLKSYQTPYDYLEGKLGDVRSAICLMENVSADLEQLISDLFSMRPKVEETLSSIEWNRMPMHGDLQEGNIIFNNDRAFLLDFEECCMGDPSYDTCYLFLQNRNNSPDDIPQLPTPSRISLDEIFAVVPLVLAVLIAWSIERLCYSEMNVVSPWLTSPNAFAAVMEYTGEKIAMLKEYLDFSEES
jgi:aminoglycoside phosphotransferase (APT) family kinase protein